MRTGIAQIVSGGQAGAERGGLDAALRLGVPHRGWCPQGFRAEDGKIPRQYNLHETGRISYLYRSVLNIIDSHATLVFTYGKPKEEPKQTILAAKARFRPCLHIDLNQEDDEQIARSILEWLSPGGLGVPGLPELPPNPVLNVAGSRESRSPGVQERVKKVMLLVLGWPATEYLPGNE